MTTPPRRNPTPLNRLRAASGLIPLIEAEIARDKALTPRASSMLSFCEWAAAVSPQSAEGARLLKIVQAGIEHVKASLGESLNQESDAKR